MDKDLKTNLPRDRQLEDSALRQILLALWDPEIQKREIIQKDIDVFYLVLFQLSQIINISWEPSDLPYETRLKIENNEKLHYELPERNHYFRVPRFSSKN